MSLALNNWAQIFFVFLNENIMWWYSLDSPHEALLMSIHNIRFYVEIRKILCGYPRLPGAMHILHLGDISPMYDQGLQNCLHIV